MRNKGPTTARGCIRKLETGKGTRKAPFESAVEKDVEEIEKSLGKKKKKNHVTSGLY